jgi:glyoxylase-like metal-dependent hydrolase (beta-lactamase superfamily II)
VARPFADPRGVDEGDMKLATEPVDAACQAPVLVSTGGAFPRNPQTLAVRWTGYANFELVYNGQILLLDTYFDRGSMYPPLGFKAADVKRADVILLGHGHVDHMSDAASVGSRTHAVVVGAPVTTEKLLTAIDRSETGQDSHRTRRRDARISRLQGRTHTRPPRRAAR